MVGLGRGGTKNGRGEGREGDRDLLPRKKKSWGGKGRRGITGHGSQVFVPGKRGGETFLPVT